LPLSFAPFLLRGAISEIRPDYEIKSHHDNHELIWQLRNLETQKGEQRRVTRRIQFRNFTKQIPNTVDFAFCASSVTDCRLLWDNAANLQRGDQTACGDVVHSGVRPVNPSDKPI